MKLHALNYEQLNYELIKKFMKKPKLALKTKRRKPTYTVGETYIIKIPNRDIWIRQEDIYFADLTAKQAEMLISNGIGNNIFKKI